MSRLFVFVSCPLSPAVLFHSMVVLMCFRVRKVLTRIVLGHEVQLLDVIEAVREEAKER